jgi:hypothetical protein
VRVTRDVGRDADEHLLHAVELGGDPLEAVEVVEAVEHDVPHAREQGLA